MPDPLPAKPTRLRLRVAPTAERHLRGGHPWLFDESIREQNRPGQAGEFAVLYDKQDRFLAIGLFDPDSPIRVRVLHCGKPATLDDAWWRARFATAVEKRKALFGPETTGYRIVHGESDGFPGLVLDRYDDALVLKLYSAAWLPHLALLRALLVGAFPAFAIVLRLSRNIQEAAARAKLTDGMVWQGALATERQTFLENGIRFHADIVRGQKTGFFLDQRDNRLKVGGLSSGRDVLNAFSFSGGFSLFAARGGARSVISLDISEHALREARENFALNQAIPAVAAARHETVQADVFEWFRRREDRHAYGLVIVDPPSLAKRESERTKAIAAYRQLAASALEKVAPGGHLVSASCSAHVSETEFFDAVRAAAATSGRKWAELETTGHPGDHPARFAEARYLKCLYLRVDR
jgi:23S rRNA (cytosine1962-C5)-methyltransferase